MRFKAKVIPLQLLYARWARPCAFEEGYTLILPSPVDMPFLLRFALEGLAHVDTTHCRQIVVVPDASVGDYGDSLQAVIDAFPDPRVELARPGRFEYFLMRKSKPGACATLHWMMAVSGINRARTAHAFLHDADAFFLERDGLERQYAACRDAGAHVLGVTARADPFFEEVGYAIPGTWELMLSTRWARSRGPMRLKNGLWPTDRGDFLFDSMLYPMYADYASGKVRVMDPPPKLVHFYGTIVTYRSFKAGLGRVDECFRVLLLAVLEDLIPSPEGRRLLPTVDALRRGLTGDPSAPISYEGDGPAWQYPGFRAMLDDLCDSPIFQGERAARVRELLRPFDEHFAARAPSGPASPPRVRTHGLG